MICATEKHISKFLIYLKLNYTEASIFLYSANCINWENACIKRKKKLIPGILKNKFTRKIPNLRMI